MKFKLAICASLLTLLICSAHAFADDIFLCMRPDESVAITTNTYDGGFYYEDMKDSNGMLVHPIISDDYNTYLPLRYICEKAGLLDGSNLESMQDGYFRYLYPYQTGNYPAVEIQYNGNYIYQNVDRPFTYFDSYGMVRIVSMYNIDGIVYAPMNFLATIVGAQELWDAKNNRIMFIKSDDAYRYVNEQGELHYDRLLQLGFDQFANNLTDSPLYLKSDGVTVGNLSDELGGVKVKSVTRSGRILYYIDETGTVYNKWEDGEMIGAVAFCDGEGNPFDVMAGNVIVVKNHLYGIQVAYPGENSGRLFCCNLDGTEFRYISDRTAFNLIMKRDGLDYYLFYGDAMNTSVIHMIKLNTMDDYEVRVIDHDGNSLISGVKQFVVGKKRMFYIDMYNGLHQINLLFDLSEIEIIRTSADCHMVVYGGTDGVSFNNVVSINLDYLNDVAYIIQKDEYGRVYCMSERENGFKPLQVLPADVTGFSLFSDLAYNNSFAAMIGNEVYKQNLYFDGTGINLAD